MSILAMSWVFDQDIRPSWVKFVLLALADNANQEGECWPCIETISAKTSQDRKTVIESITKLEEMGLLIDTGHRTGKTKQIKVYKFNGLPSEIEQHHYVYKLLCESTGEFYIGVRSCFDEVDNDKYNGSGKWPLKMRSQKIKLIKSIVSEFPTRQHAEVFEAQSIKDSIINPLCMNKLNYTAGGILRKSRTVPPSSSNSTVQLSKEYRARDTEPLLTVNESKASNKFDFKKEKKPAPYEALVEGHLSQKQVRILNFRKTGIWRDEWGGRPNV